MMKKQWVAPVIETLGLEMTEQVSDIESNEVFFTDQDIPLLVSQNSGDSEEGAKDKI